MKRIISLFISVIASPLLVLAQVPVGNITFQDATAKSICVAHWDTNNDGDLSYAEAAAVTEITEESGFKENHDLVTFDEFQYFTNVTTIGERAFNNCSKLTSITLPNSVTSIGDGAFAECSSLPSVDIPNGVTSLGNSVFGRCLSLTSIILPNGITKLGDSTFEACYNLQSVTLPENLKVIGSHAFYECSNLESIDIPENVKIIEEASFQSCNKLSSIVIPEGCTYIGGGAFVCGFAGLISITIPSTVTYLGSDLFGTPEWSMVREVHIAAPPTVKCVWPTAATLFVPDEPIEAYRTAWPDKAHMIVPESAATYEYSINVTEAGEDHSAVIEAIGEENALNVVKLKVSGPINSYDVMAFRNKMVNLLELDLSDAVLQDFSNYHYYSNNESENYHTKAHVITSRFAPRGIKKLTLPKDITALEPQAFIDASWLQSITLPEGITTIPEQAFKGCRSLKSIFIPESVTSIDAYAFESCAFSSISFPTGLQRIGSNVFETTNNLTEIHLPPYLSTIEDGAFSGVNEPTLEKLESVYAYMPDIIPIGGNTFKDYKRLQLYIPDFLYDKYYMDTNWSQFLNINRTELKPGDYKRVPMNSDVTMGEDDQRIPDTAEGNHVDGEINTQGSFTVEGDTPQSFDTVEQALDGEGQGGSLIGDDDGETQGNLAVDHLRVKINVKPSRWYFFCFPFDVTIADCEYPGQYAWRYYDGEYRAENGEGGWKVVTGATLNARQGYAFQTSHAGKLVVKFESPAFGGNRGKSLEAHAATEAQNASWNFVGNPYSCFYEFNELDFTSPITVWDGTTYTAYSPGIDDYMLQPYEAFFVQKPNGTTEIDFVIERRTTYNKGQAKKAANVKARRAKGINPQRRLINLEIKSGEDIADRTRVVLNPKATRAYELECDAAKFLSTIASAQLYSVEGGVQMAINERPLEGDIRLGYVAKQAGTFSISASRMDLPMLIVDTNLGVTFDLSLGSYDFDTQAGTFEGRFFLRPSGEATAVNGLMAKTGVCIGTQAGGIAIGGAEDKTINVYTTSGTPAALHTGNGFIALKSGVYVVNVDGVSAKIFVK